MTMPSEQKSEDQTPSKFNWRRLLLFGVPITSAAALFVAGIIFWGGFNTAMEATNTLNFCISCHEMESTVYQEYKTTVHYQNRTGVRATCSDCHVPDPWVHKFIRKVEASRELFHKALGSINTPEKFEAKRLTLAKNVWHAMKSTDSRECRNCHNFESMAPEFQRPRARTQHLNAFKTGQTCIDCHKGIAHKNVRDKLPEEELEALEKPDPKFARAVPALYLESLKRIEAIEAKAVAEEQKQQEAAEAAVTQRIQSAVTAAVAKAQAEAEAAAKVATAPKDTQPSIAAADAATPAQSGSGIDWAGVKAKAVTLFYPGQTSFEWVQTGKDHGGARAFAKLGDRCASCHAKEVKDMGAKLVSGEKAEPTPIPGKRGHVDVKVQAVHDADNIYLRFQWPDAPHTPAPFVEGGKMDPGNQVKLAMMIAGKDVDKAEQAGCWATCHHDSRYMPHEPDAAAISEAGEAAKSIDPAEGITKYLADSRTKVEIKGRRGKKRGGWSKLKSTEELAELTKAGTYMELLRFRSGGAVEHGQILAKRTLAEAGTVTGSGSLENGIWTVELSRPLAADKTNGVALKSGEIYTVGFALHDDYTSARFHHVSLEIKLGLDNPDAELNVAAK